MIGRALDAGVLAGWAGGEEVHGADPGLHASLERRGMSYVLAAAKDHRATAGAGPLRADVLAARLPPRAWQRLSAGSGAKGHRWHDWAWVAIEPGRPGCHWLLIRRHRRTHELAYYRCYLPAIIGWAPWCGLPGAGGPVRRTSQASKGLEGLDEHQVRTWTSWYRWVTLAMPALAFLTAACITERGQRPRQRGWSRCPATRSPT